MMGLKVTQDKVIALAGLSQAAALVTQIAEESKIDELALTASVRSVLNIDVTDVTEIFGGTADLRLGLTRLSELLGGLSGLRAQSQIRYMMSMDQLASRLSSAAHTQALVAQGVQELNITHGETLAMNQDGELDPWEVRDLYERLGLLYQKSLSQLPPRIIVKGAKGKLSSVDNVAKLRSALFAGVRAAYLWHQLGGRRWHLLFMRKAYAECAKTILL